jgi:hypothetical protein
MSDPAPPSDDPGGGGAVSPLVRRILTVVFSVAALGSLVLVAVDLAVGRPAAGDVLIAVLNSLAAAVFWRWSAQSRRT